MEHYCKEQLTVYTIRLTSDIMSCRHSCERKKMLDLYRPIDKDTYYHSNVYLEPTCARRIHCAHRGNSSVVTQLDSATVVTDQTVLATNQSVPLTARSVPVTTSQSTSALQSCSATSQSAPDTSHQSSSTTQKECKFCGACYAHRASLFKHLRKEHSNEQQCSGNIKCLEEMCTFTCHYLDGLRYHLKTVHSIPMETEEMKFKCFEGTYI